MSYRQSDGRETTYPNQPAGISDQNWRVATNIGMWLSHDRDMPIKGADIGTIARVLQNEYGDVPDTALAKRFDELKIELIKLEAKTRTAFEAYGLAWSPEGAK